MELLAGEQIEVGVGQGAALAQNVSVGVVEVLGHQNLGRIDKRSDVPVPIRMVAGVRARIPHGECPVIRAGQQSTNPTGTVQRAAQSRPRV